MNIRIKLCGMTRPQDATQASVLGADAVGMIFYPPSARNVSIAQAKEIIASVHPLCGTVAVMVNPEASFVDQLIEQLDIQMLQFHGDESPEFCRQFRVPYIKAVRMKADTGLGELQRQHEGARALLLDTFDKTLAGGTGKAFDWALLDDPDAGVDKTRLILAGGIGPDNAHAAIVQTGVHTLDINSGIESTPGIKDHKKMQAVMALANSLSSIEEEP